MPRHFRTGIARKYRVEKERRRGNDCDAEESRRWMGAEPIGNIPAEARNFIHVEVEGLFKKSV
jgi:hypothetical protein